MNKVGNRICFIIVPDHQGSGRDLSRVTIGLDQNEFVKPPFTPNPRASVTSVAAHECEIAFRFDNEGRTVTALCVFGGHMFRDG